MCRFGVLSHPDFVRDMQRRAALTQFFARLPADVEEHNDIAARYAALEQLPADELSRLGLTRNEIARAAVLGNEL